jgi:hypothetical protein
MHYVHQKIIVTDLQQSRVSLDNLILTLHLKAMKLVAVILCRMVSVKFAVCKMETIKLVVIIIKRTKVNSSLTPNQLLHICVIN